MLSDMKLSATLNQKEVVDIVVAHLKSQGLLVSGDVQVNVYPASQDGPYSQPAHFSMTLPVRTATSPLSNERDSSDK